MSEELENVCVNCGFDDNFKEYLKGVEMYYKLISNKEKSEDGEPFTMFEWIMKNTDVEELKCLSEKERFLYGLGILSSEIMNY